MRNARRLARTLGPVLLAAALVACVGEGGEPPGSPPAPTSPAAEPASPPPGPASPLPAAGAATADCVDGWRTPLEGDRLWKLPLRVIRRTTGVRGPLVVVDMRYFLGPESPPSKEGDLEEVERWYVKLHARQEPSFRGRFLVERRPFGSGVSAVASYDSKGFRSPDWVGFQLDSRKPRAYPGLPGAWAGIPYDFVEGGAGLTIPGLPEEAVGCLEGT